MLITQTPWSSTLVSGFRDIAFFEHGWGSYMVAGGCLRDEYFGKPVKDIDIFYWGELPENIKTAFHVIAVANEQYPNTLFKCTHKGRYGTFIVDFIQVKDQYTDPQIVLESFPCSLSQICQYGSENTVVQYTEQFKKSVEQNIIYFDEDCPEEYVERICTKYPDKDIQFVDMPAANNSILWGSITNVQWSHIGTTVTYAVPDDIATFADELVNKKKKLVVKKKYKVINTLKKDCYKEGTL